MEKDSCGVGFVAHIKGKASHQIMLDACHVNSRMDHRGGCGFEKNTGDGAGILTALPFSFFREIARKALGDELPADGLFSVGNIFLPRDKQERGYCQETIARVIAEEGQELLGWRAVPVNSERAGVGPAARSARPHIEQLFVGAQLGLSNDEFERKLYIIRKRFTHLLRGNKDLKEALNVYACSLSTKIIIYKGMLTPGQLFPFYDDLQNPAYETHLAMVHSRFSTNTFPSWDRAQPNRFMSHNGEINTLRGNANSMTSREGIARSDLFGDDISKLFPIVEPDCSDSGTFDNVLEFLLMSGRTLQEAIMMMIPEAWQADENMSQHKRDFYEYNSALMEPWDGPASIVFTDGHYIGAVLDRNGLRPSRYYVTKDDRVIMASEVGVLPVEPDNVLLKGRLQPGRMFLIDFEQGRLIPDEELKDTFSKGRPYGKWLRDQKLALADLEPTVAEHQFEPESLIQRMQTFGYTVETMQFMLKPLVTEARDPLGSMGNDSALACLSDSPRMIYDYFKQLFAQVTNPAIDSIREEVVMSLQCFIGPESNILEISEKNIHRLCIPHPILSNEELGAMKRMDHRDWKAQTIDITYAKEQGTSAFMEALDRMCEEAAQAIDDGYSLIILSDRKVSATRIPISSLIATGAVHQHLVATHQRTQIGIIVESGEAREVHHHWPSRLCGNQKERTCWSLRGSILTTISLLLTVRELQRVCSR
jgi:glutamate synthase (NADPH/NADH) large chain